MLSPNNNPIALLPQDRALMEVLGLNEAEYRGFVRDCYKYSRLQPGMPVCFLDPFTIALIFFVVGLIINVGVSLLLRPRPPARPADIRQTSLPGQNVVGRSEYAPKAGFDSLQSVVELGSIIPLVYTKRETIDGITYGGVRVNTNMVWSQMQSLGGSQMLRAVFLIGEAVIEAIDSTQFAFGDNTLGSYDLSTANSTSSRATLYISTDGGRLVSADRAAGRSAANDTGNAQNAGASDVFQIRGLNNNWATDFCYASKPGTQTKFGLYQLIGNGFGFRVNPALRSALIVKTSPSGNKGNTRISCDPDGVGIAQRAKYNNIFSSRSGVTERNNVPTAGTISLAINDTVTYYLSSASDAATVFTGVQEGLDHNETCRDVAQTVSGRQRGWDDALTIGDMYRLGSALLICESRSPDDEIFRSEIDQEPIGGGQPITVTLRCVRAGTAELNPTTGTSSATATSHLFKVAIASFATPRSAQVVEIGLRSGLGMRINGLCNFRDALSETEIDGRACAYYDGKVYSPGQSLELSNYSSGSFSGAEVRYSFFKIGYRIAGSDTAYTYISQCFGTRSLTQQSSYNYIRLQMPSVQRWEFRIEPVSGWEVRSSTATGTLEVLDANISGTRTVTSGSSPNVVTAIYSGEPVARSSDTFSVAATRDRALGVSLADTGDYADAWGKLAEEFVFEELKTSASAPEHEVVYINTLTANPTTPEYDSMALVGINLRSSTEFNQLNQLSVYINEGINSVHTFPEVLNDLLTNTRYGVGSTLSPEQIDIESFADATDWTYNRRYFFDGALSAPINLRQWGSQTASYFLLDFVIRNGRFALQPALYFDQPEPITSLYTAGNIIEDSFGLAYSDVEQRTPVRVSVKWRQEKASGDASNRGLFPVIREVTVREAGTAENAPLESIDLTDFCTSEKHAIDVGKFISKGRRLITHSVQFKTVPTQAALAVGRCFKLGLETIAYNQPNNGAIDSVGTITSTEPLADGTYDVLLWRGVGNALEERSITVKDQYTDTVTSAIFCLKQSSTEVRTYKVQSLGFDEDGNINVEATYFPLTSTDYSLIAEGWEVSSNWIIEGALETTEDAGATISSFTGIRLTGPSTVSTNVASTFTALVSGGAGAYTYAWSGTGITFGSASSATTTATATSAGSKTISCTVSRSGTSFTESKTILVVTPTTLTTIGTVTITGSSTALINVPKNYTATFSGTTLVTNVIYSWSVTPDVDTYTNTSSATATITFDTAGTYIVSCLISAPTASDSPVTQTKTITVT